MEEKELKRKHILSIQVTVFIIIAVALLIPLACKDTLVFRLIEYKNVSNLFAAEVTLFACAVTTLVVIASFLKERYLGANRKFWIFKKRIFLLLPQDIIMLMIDIIFVSGICCGYECYGWLVLILFAVFMVLLVWIFMIIYVALVKFSWVFIWVDRKLIKEKNKELCDEIYYKLPVMLIDEHEHNSYLEEEIKILKDMKKIYSDDAEKRERIEHVINKLFTKEADLQSKFWGSTYRAKKELNEKFSK